MKTMATMPERVQSSFAVCVREVPMRTQVAWRPVFHVNECREAIRDLVDQ